MTTTKALGTAFSLPVCKTGANTNKNLFTIAALFIATIPYAAHAQGTIHGAEEGAAAGERAAAAHQNAPLGAIVVVRSAPQPVPSAASWASKSGRGFANTLYVSTIPRSVIAARRASAT
jgi:hypothetical protein